MTNDDKAAAPRAGDELAPFGRGTGLENWNRFAAVNDEFVAIHMDDAAGRAAGYSGAIGMGNLQWSYLHSLIRAWLGDGGRIVSLAVQFRRPNTKGMTVLARGTITSVRDGHGCTFVDLDVWTEDGDGNLLAPGTATIALRG
jgi:acyl dehydratase